MLILCTVIVAITSISISSFSLFLRPIEAEFHWSRSMVTVPYMFSMLGWGIGAVVFGKLADDYGTRRVILGGIVLMTFGFVGMSLSQNLWQLSLSYGAMVGLAIGACGLAIVSLLIAKHFDAKGRGFAVSVIQTAPPLSPLVFAPLLYFIIKNFGWRGGAAATAALLALIALPLAWFIARDPTDAGPKRERTSWSSCLPHLRERSMMLMFAARFSCGVAFFQIAHLVPLTVSKGFSVAAGATAVSVFGASAVVSALLFGWLSDRHNRTHILALTYIIRGIGTLFLAANIPNEWLFYLLIALAVGPTFGTVAVQNVIFYEAVGPRLAGVILGLSFIVHQFGSAGGPMLASLAFDLTGSYDGFMVIMAVVLLLSGALVYRAAGTSMSSPEPVLQPSTVRS